MVDEIRFIHSLEHMGADTGVFLGIIKETYRVLKPGGTVRIEVPHPRHDYFLGDPTHVRAITARQMLLFDRRLNDEWKAAKSSAATPLAHYLDVDFEMVEQTELADPRHLAAIKAGRMSVDELIQAGLEQNNVFTEIHMTLKARKP